MSEPDAKPDREARRYLPGQPRRGRPPSALNDERKAAILAKIREGFSLGTASRLCGCSPRVIQRRADREPSFGRELVEALAVRTALFEQRVVELAQNAKNPSVSLEACRLALSRTGGAEWSDQPRERAAALSVQLGPVVVLHDDVARRQMPDAQLIEESAPVPTAALPEPESPQSPPPPQGQPRPDDADFDAGGPVRGGGRSVFTDDLYRRPSRN